ncbi:MAG TPA: MFS transporter [Rhizomicrobium sp.]|jgi:MFS family permease
MIRSRALSLAAILSSCIAYGIGMGLTLPLLALILERMGEPGSVNGLNSATGGLAALAIAPFAPRLMARFGAAQLLMLALAVSAGGMLAIYEAPNLWAWFPIRFVLSSGLNLLFVIAEFWVNRLADNATRGRYIALYSICFAGAYGIGPALLQIIGTHGIAPFATGAAMMLLGIVPVFFARKTAPRLDNPSATSIFGVLRMAPIAFAAALVFGAIDSGMAGLLPVYAVREGYSEANAALCVTAMALGSIVFQYPLGALADRMSKRTLLAICASTGVFGAALTPFAIATPMLLYLLLFLWGGVILGMYSIGLTLLGERFPGSELAHANAGFVMMYCAGLLVGPAVEGYGLDVWNPHGLLVVLGAICAVYVGWVALSRAKPAEIQASTPP